MSQFAKPLRGMDHKHGPRVIDRAAPGGPAAAEPASVHGAGPAAGPAGAPRVAALPAPRAGFCDRVGGALRTTGSYVVEATRAFAPNFASLQFGALRYAALQTLVNAYNANLPAEQQVKPGDSMYFVLDYAVSALAFTSYQGVFGAAHVAADASVSFLRDAINWGASKIGDYPVADAKGADGRDVKANPLFRIPGGPVSIDRSQLTAITFAGGAAINAGINAFAAWQGRGRPPSLIAPPNLREYAGSLAAVSGLVLSTTAPAADRPLQAAPTPLSQTAKWLGEKWKLMQARMLALDDVQFRTRMAGVPTALVQAALPSLLMPLAHWAAPEQEEGMAALVALMQFAIYHNLASEWGVANQSRGLDDKKFTALHDAQAGHPRRAAFLERVGVERAENKADPRQDAFGFTGQLWKQASSALVGAIYLHTVLAGLPSSEALASRPEEWYTGLAMGFCLSGASIAVAHSLLQPESGHERYTTSLLGSTAASVGAALLHGMAPGGDGLMLPMAVGGAIAAGLEPIVSRVVAEDSPQPPPPVVLEDARPAALPEASAPEVDLERGDARPAPSHERASDGRGDLKGPTPHPGSGSASGSDHSPLQAWSPGPAQGTVPPKSVSRPVTPLLVPQLSELPGSVNGVHAPRRAPSRQASLPKFRVRTSAQIRQPDFGTPPSRENDDSSRASVTIHGGRRQSPPAPHHRSSEPGTQGEGPPLTPAGKVDVEAPD